MTTKNSFLVLFFLLFSVFFAFSTKTVSATSFTIDTIENNSFDPSTTPSFKGSGKVTVMSGTATPDAKVLAKLTGGPTGVITKTGFGFPTERWSISFEGLYNANYNVELTSEGTTINFVLVIDDYPYEGQASQNEDLEKLQNDLVAGNSTPTLLLLALGLFLVLIFPTTLKAIRPRPRQD